LSARAAVKKPGAPSGLSQSASTASQDDADEDAREETAALIHELKERLQKAETASEEYQKQIEGLHARLDDAVKDQARLEERVHEEEERVEGLENEKRESIRQQRELEAIYEVERVASMKDKEEAQSRGEALQEIIQRLKEAVAHKDLRSGDAEEGRLSRTCKALLS
jgi:chromosome segregation ATPase